MTAEPSALSTALASLLQEVDQAVAPTVPGVIATWPTSMSKKEAVAKFEGAIYKLADGSIRFAAAPVARGDNELVLSSATKTEAKVLINGAQADSDVRAVVLGA
eukprot:4919212-Prymnesium_polylepis.1